MLISLNKKHEDYPKNKNIKTTKKAKNFGSQKKRRCPQFNHHTNHKLIRIVTLMRRIRLLALLSRVILLGSIGGTLTNCSVHKMQFECKSQSGVGCKSISEVNEFIDNGSLLNKPSQQDSYQQDSQQNNLSLSFSQRSNRSSNKFESLSDNNKSSKLPSLQALPTKAASTQPNHTFNNNNDNHHYNIVRDVTPQLVSHPSDQTVSRTTDKIIRIWFNNYVDGYNNLRGEQYVYTIAEGAKWVIQ
jgi:hypothetical protein